MDWKGLEGNGQVQANGISLDEGSWLVWMLGHRASFSAVCLSDISKHLK